MSVFWQDVKSRQVFWFWFPIIAICCGVLLYQNISLELLFTTLVINLLFVSMLLLVVLGYSKFKLKTHIKHTFGLGDAILFIALTFSFTSVSFIVLFVFGLLCALVLHLALKHKSKHHTVPLAGYLSLFFGLAYLSHWLGFLSMIYQF